MKTLKTIITISVLFLAFLTIGCAQPPVEEMNSAIEAVTRAENDNDAITYAANSITRARDALARMHSEAASKNYDAARSYAGEAIAIAERAINEGRLGAARARDEASALVSELRPMVAETEQGINAARAAGLPIDYESLASDFSVARTSAGQAETALNNGRYNDSIIMGRSARSDLNGINQRLSNAVIAATRVK